MFALVLSSCSRSETSLPTVQLTIGETVVTAEVVDTIPLRARGLMERTELDTDHGMLFVYPEEGMRSFWMKNTLIPLSIAFINAQGRIVHTADMEPLDETSVLSMYPAMYALEMNRGWFVRHGVQVGHRVEGLPPRSEN